MRRTTGQCTATNYGTEGGTLGEDGTSIPVFMDGPGGPFWTHPQIFDEPSSGYLLTKTHCGGYCNSDACMPHNYILTAERFSEHCLLGQYITKDDNNKTITVHDSYPQDIVSRAVHVIRDPIDNIVARFHSIQKEYVRTNQTEKIAMYPSSKEGFRAFCKHMDKQFIEREHYKEEVAAEVFEDLIGIVKHVPCHADFFRYIQWHNHAFATTRDLNLPTMILHYENYTTNFNETTDMLLEFLDKDCVNEPPLFVTGKTYREYFTEKEIVAVSVMFSKLGSNETWDHTEHYLASKRRVLSGFF